MSTPQYWLEYTFTPSEQTSVDDLVRHTEYALKQAMARTVNGKLLFLFKVVAEPKLVAVVQAANNAELESVLAADPVPSLGRLVQVQCVALRPYEAFAKDVLGVDTSFQQTEEWADIPGNVYWVTAEVEYRGMTQEELFKLWAEEAMPALSAMERGAAKVFKVVSERKILALMKKDTPDQLDDTIFGMPMYKKMGDQMHATCKPVVMKH